MNPLTAIRHRGVIGNGLVPSHDATGRLLPHEIVAGQSRRLRSYTSAADAWRAIDVIDLDDEFALTA
jgi:hypothetical protein